MHKKSIASNESENMTDQTEFSNPALHDIIATNHVILSKKSNHGRLSRACKIAIVMIILGLVTIGIIVSTLVLAHSRNTLMSIMSRSELNSLEASNSSRLLILNQENMTTMVNQQTENEHWQNTTVTLTTSNLNTPTNQNVHISSTSMTITKQQNEHVSFDIQSMKPYPSLKTILNEQTTIITPIHTTVSTQQTKYESRDNYFTANITTNDNLRTTMRAKENSQTSFETPPASIVDNFSTLVSDEIAITTTSVPKETSFTIFLNQYFDIESSTISLDEIKTQTETQKILNNKSKLEDDVIDDILFS